MDKKETVLKLLPILLPLIFGGISGAILQNEWSKQNLESELVIVDMHLEQKTNDQFPFNVSIMNMGTGVVENFSFLYINVTFVNSAYSKYPLKLMNAMIVYNGAAKKTSKTGLIYEEPGKIGYEFQRNESLPTIVYFSSEPIYPSKEGKITFYKIIPLEGNYNLTGTFHIWYYDPMTDKIKHKSDDVYILQIQNGKLEKVTPLKAYVTIKGYDIENYEIGLFG